MRLYFVIFKHCDLLTLVILQSVTIQWQIVLFFNNPTKKQQNKKRLEIAKFTKTHSVWKSHSTFNIASGALKTKSNKTQENITKGNKTQENKTKQNKT